MPAAFHTMDLVGNLLQLSSPTLPLHTSTALFLQEDPDFSIPLLPPSFPAAAGLIHVRREWLLPDPNHYLRSLSDRIAALELAADADEGADRKYKWTSEVTACDGLERRHRLEVEVKGGKMEEKSFKWSAKVTGKGADGPIAKTYTFRSSAAPAPLSVNKEKKWKKEKARAVEIEDADPAALALKQVFAKRKALAIKNAKGKKKELSPQDAAILIQFTFRAHLVRKSKALRDLRELAVAKAKLKEIRAMFNNFSYRLQIARDAEERQRFSEKIIVLLLTVDAIEGTDIMVRVARKAMVDELEAMLEVVDPQPAGRLSSLKRRKFDLPEGPLQKEIAMGVAEVVQLLDQEDNGSSAFEVSL